MVFIQGTTPAIRNRWQSVISISDESFYDVFREVCKTSLLNSSTLRCLGFFLTIKSLKLVKIDWHLLLRLFLANKNEYLAVLITEEY